MASKLRPNGVNRRNFLRISAIGTATTVLGIAPAGPSAHAAALTKAQRDKLTPDEWGIMKMHARLGSDAIDLAERDIEQDVEFLSLAKEIAHWHHERWDGSGYPDGLAGKAIPLSARLMALADVFDALISVRVYKPAMPFEQARDIILAGRGTQFDPDVTDAFIASFDEFVGIAKQHGEEG